MTEILFHFRDCFKYPRIQFRTGYNLSAVAQVAGEHREQVRSLGEQALREAIAGFADNIVQCADHGSEEGVYRASTEAAVFMYLLFTEFTGTTRQMMDGAVFELVKDTKSKGAAVHLGLAGNPLDPPLMCFSAQIDAFVSLQRNAVSLTNQVMWDKLCLVDRLLILYEDLIALMAQEKAIHPVLSNFALSIQLDLAPAITLAMGGRVDAAFAISRRAIEIVGFFRVMVEDPASIQIWTFSGTDEDARRAFKGRFNTKKLFPRASEFWHGMYNKYDALSARHHPNPASFSRTEWEPMEDGGLKLTVNQLHNSLKDAEANVADVWQVLELFHYCLLGMEMSLRHILKTDELQQKNVELSQLIKAAMDA